MSGDEKTSQLTLLAGADVEDADYFPIINADDTTTPPADADGSNQRITAAELAIAMAARIPSGGTVESVVAGTNVTVDDTDPANPIVSATGSGGSARAFFSYAEPGLPGGRSITSDGNVYPLALDTSDSPPAWLDGSGNIIQGGIYTVGYEITTASGGGFTTPNTKFTATVDGVLFGAYGTRTHQFDATVMGDLGVTVGNTETFSLADADTPWPVSIVIYTEVDATGVLAVSLFASRLL